MDKRRAALIALIAAIGGVLVWGGYATWGQWRGFVFMMFGGM